jgi:hypothetical protein
MLFNGVNLFLYIWMWFTGLYSARLQVERRLTYRRMLVLKVFPFIPASPLKGAQNYSFHFDFQKIIFTQEILTALSSKSDGQKIRNMLNLVKIVLCFT